MVSKATIRGGQTCVWMDAGLLTYKLCDRGFDCEHCPLDAALRGTTCDADRPARATGSERTDQTKAEAGEVETGPYPDDRLYSASHTWIQRVAGSAKRFRFGLDGFGAAVMPEPIHLRLAAPPTRVGSGDRLCEIRFRRGGLRISSPIDAEVVGWNGALEKDAGALVRAPYGAGWIAELEMWAPDDAEGRPTGLLTSSDAREKARLDARRFRRRMAFHLLAGESNGAHAGLNGDGRLYADIRQWLGWPRFFELLQEAVG